MMQQTKKPKSISKPQSSQNKKPIKPQKLVDNKIKESFSKPQSKIELNQKSSSSIPSTSLPVQTKPKPVQNLAKKAEFEEGFEEDRKESAHFPEDYQENSEILHYKPINNQENMKKTNNLKKTPFLSEDKLNQDEHSNSIPIQKNRLYLEEQPRNTEEKQKMPHKPDINNEKHLKKPSDSKKDPRSLIKNQEVSKRNAPDSLKKDIQIKSKQEYIEFDKENKNKELGLYNSLNKRQILQRLTDKIYILTDELDKLSRIASQNMEDNRAWKSKYNKLKELYLKNVDEDLNPDIYFEGAEYNLDFKGESNNDDKLKEMTSENIKVSNMLKKCQESLEEYKSKIQFKKQTNNEISQKLMDIETGYQNKIKILQNNLEILKTDQNNRNTVYSEEKYQKLLKGFLALKEEKDQMESLFQKKILETNPNSSNMISIPNEEADVNRLNEVNREKIEVTQKKIGKDLNAGKKTSLKK